MIWVCRAGKNACYLEMFLENNRIYLPWEGYKADLSKFDSVVDFRALVIKEKNIDNQTSVSNWSGQLRSFVNEMQINDLVLLPDVHSRKYHLVKIVNDYEYLGDKINFSHSRKIKVLVKDIPRNIFPQSIQYSLGAYRTLFKVKREDDILKMILMWKEETERAK